MSMKPPDSPQTIARQLPPTKRAIEARQGGWTDFLQGIPVLARFKKSVRVGSGSLSGLDSFDGLITADGATAGYAFRNRGDAAQYGQLYRSGTLYQIDNETGAHLWQWDSAQLAWVAPTLLNSWANFGAGFPTAGYRKDHSGFVHLKGIVKNGIGIGSANPIFTLPVGFRPATERGAAVESNGAFGAVRVATSGNVYVSVGATDFVYLDNISFDPLV